MGSPGPRCLGQGAAPMMLPLALGVSRAEELGTGHVGHGPAVARGQQDECFLSHCFVPFKFYTISIFLKFNFFNERNLQTLVS